MAMSFLAALPASALPLRLSAAGSNDLRLIQYKRVTLAQGFFFLPASSCTRRLSSSHLAPRLSTPLFILLDTASLFTMDQRLLPDPTQFGFHGRPGGTLESALSGASHLHIQPDHIFQLPPIRELKFKYETPSSEAMSRRPSDSSAASYYSDFQLSRSSSPSINSFGESGYGRSLSVNSFSTCTPELISCSKPRSPTAKAVRTKRKDRKHFSRLRKEAEGAHSKFTKEQGEAGRRYDHSLYFAVLQRALLGINENFPESAVQGKDQKPGWTPLKSNNRSEDVSETTDENGVSLSPLRFNKNNIFASAYQVIVDSNEVLESIYDRQCALEIEADALLQREPTREELMAYVRATRDSAAASHIAMASAQRGSIGFRAPFSRRGRSML